MKRTSSNDLTYAYVSSRLDYDLTTGILTWRAKDASCGEVFWRRWNKQYAGRRAGSALYMPKTGKTYWRVNIDGKKYLAHRLAWILHHGSWPELDLDHKDGHSTNNRIDNLRQCTKSQNSYNVAGRNGTSQYKGVSKTRSGRWVAQLVSKGLTILSKTFACEVEAARAYDAVAREIFGEFAYLNFPGDDA